MPWENGFKVLTKLNVKAGDFEAIYILSDAGKREVVDVSGWWRRWYRRPHAPAQQLEWDLSAQELYIGNTSFLRVGIVDDDDHGIRQNLARDFSDLIIRLRDYMDSKPPEIYMLNQEMAMI